MRRIKSTYLLIITFFIGLSLLLYPSFSDYWNSFHQSRAIASYAESVANIEKDTYDRLWNEAVSYNNSFADRLFNLSLTEEEREEYINVLDVTGTGIMGYIEIPKIGCSFPIYHGTDEAVLQIAIGHLEGTSLPVGGIGTHSVLSGHRGLPSARLFTDIDRLSEGDDFMIRVLDETLTYEVDQILIVLPNELDELQIVKGQDYCTLVTCTPYGINTHRILVRGHRVETTNAKQIRVTADAVQMEPKLVSAAVAIPVLLMLGLVVMLTPSRRRRQN